MEGNSKTKNIPPNEFYNIFDKLYGVLYNYIQSNTIK